MHRLVCYAASQCVHQYHGQHIVLQGILEDHFVRVLEGMQYYTALLLKDKIRCLHCYGSQLFLPRSG